MVKKLSIWSKFLTKKTQFMVKKLSIWSKFLTKKIQFMVKKFSIWSKFLTKNTVNYGQKAQYVVKIFD